MINVTAPAKDVLQDVLTDATKRAGVNDDQMGLRLALTSDSGQPQLGLVLDAPKEGDQIIEYEGKNVLMVSEPVAAQFDGVTLDTTDTPEGKRLTLIREE
jgi:hypothetical protein